LALAEAQKYLDKPDTFDLEEMPINFNWEDVMGFDFTGDVKDQKGCGSCYAIATTSMLESRVKIWFGKEK
jgi:C1A family cysteine protease